LLKDGKDGERPGTPGTPTSSKDETDSEKGTVSHHVRHSSISTYGMSPGTSAPQR